MSSTTDSRIPGSPKGTCHGSGRWSPWGLRRELLVASTKERSEKGGNVIFFKARVDRKVIFSTFQKKNDGPFFRQEECFWLWFDSPIECRMVRFDVEAPMMVAQTLNDPNMVYWMSTTTTEEWSVQSNTAAWTCNIKISTEDIFAPSLPSLFNKCLNKWLKVFFWFGKGVSRLC